MHILIAVFLACGLASAQTDPGTRPDASVPAINAGQLTIPAGTKVPLALKQSISTKNAREGDSVYAVTTFPVVFNDRIVIPAGTYVQGKISRVKRGGRIKGRAEVLMHFSTLIYPSGYTVVLPGAVENVPGAEKTSMKDEEGTIRQDSQTGEKAKTVATAAGTGAVIGGLSNGVKGGSPDLFERKLNHTRETLRSGYASIISPETTYARPARGQDGQQRTAQYQSTMQPADGKFDGILGALLPRR